MRARTPRWIATVFLGLGAACNALVDGADDFSLRSAPCVDCAEAGADGTDGPSVPEAGADAPTGVAGPDPRAPWPMWGANAAHTARAPFVAGKLTSQRWRIDNVNSANAPAIAADGSVFIVNNNGPSAARILKLGSAFAAEGVPTIDWSRGLVGRSRATPAVASNGNVFVTSEKGLMAIDSGGAVLFELPIGGDSSPVLGMDGTVYVVDDAVHAVDPAGFERWSYPLGPRAGRRHEAVALDETGVVYAVRDGLHAISQAGKRLWRNEKIDGSVAPPPVLARDKIYVGSGPNLVAVSISTHEIVWSTGVTGALRASPGADASGRLHYVCGTKLCIQGDDGLGDPTPSSVDIEQALQPAIDRDGRVLVPSGRDELRDLVLLGGQAIIASGSVSLITPVVGIAIASNGTVLVATGDSLTALAP